MKLILASIFLLLGQDLLAQTSYVPPTKILGQKGYQIGVSGEIFTSSQSLDDKGEKTKFEDGEAFSRFQGEFSGQYGLTDNFQIGGGLRYRQNRSTILENGTGEEVTETSTGIQSTFINLMYGFKPVDRLHYTLEGIFRYTPYTNKEASSPSEGDLILGDDGNEYSLGLGVTYATPMNNFLTGRVGYRRPGQEISDEIYWQVEGAMAWKYLALVAGVDGVSSMNNDPYAEGDPSRPIFNTGRSSLYHTSNREWIAPYAGLNLALGQTWRVELRGSQVVSGRSTDLGTAFGVSLIRRVEDKKSAKVDSRFKEYDMEASITKISPKKGFVVIDKGLSSDVQKGMKIDFYEFDYVGGNILLARGTVIQVKSESAIVKITQRYNTKKELKEGTVARGIFR